MPESVPAPEHVEDRALNIDTEKAGPPPSKRRRALIIIGAIAAAIILGVVAYMLINAGTESTDDAEINANVVALAPRVAGKVATVAIHDNQHVNKGDLVLQVDDRDYQLRVDQAQAELESARFEAEAAEAKVAVAEAAAHGSLTEAQAGVLGSTRMEASARAQLNEARATLASREAEEKLATVNLARARELRKAQAIPQQQLDQVETQYTSAQSSLEAARASVTAAEELLRRAQAQVAESQGRLNVAQPVDASIAAAQANASYLQARVKSAEANLEQAKLSLEWTRLLAPGDGVVSNIGVHPGSFVAVGQTVAQFVPDEKYVTADFKETQLGHMHPGQRAEVHVDTYDQTLQGRVESIAGGTGARFSLLPPNNATGNYVKVTQRVPVRIALENVPPQMTLRAGQSVEVTVDVSD
jgi:membrane fusion protein (multidrug efflux system)